MTDALRCPLCGRLLPIDGPAGVCPACVLRLGLETHADGATAGTAPAPADLAPFFPQLEILDLIGQGGMGTVYKARQRSLDRLVALKILLPGTAADPAFEERFVRESRTLAQLTHPNIVTVFDSGRAGGYFYLVMEYVDGVNLRTAIDTRALSPADALPVVRQVCDALQHAHDAGIVHRDIKPENILLDSRGRVQIADFGLAKLLGQTPIEISLTATHQVLGTFRYMAPEQLERPMSVDHRADIYSLGVVLYELLTGELPLGRFALPSERGTAGAGLDRVVLRALERDPVRRYQHASELKTDVGEAGTTAEPPSTSGVAPIMSLPFTASMVFMQNATAKGIVELHDDRVSLNFEVVSLYGPRTLRSADIPLDRVRSVSGPGLSGLAVQMVVEPGPWTVPLPFAKKGTIGIQVRSKQERDAFVAAVQARLLPGRPLENDSVHSGEGVGVLKVFPKTFSSTFLVTDTSLQPVTRALKRASWPEKWEFTVEDVAYTARREGVASGEFLLESPDGVIARATKPSALRRSLTVEHEGHQYTLRSMSAWTRAYEVLDGPTRVGTIAPDHAFTQRASADLPPAIPLAVRVFLIWLTVLAWRRDRAM
jgi:serine/threonine protein kinase